MDARGRLTASDIPDLDVLREVLVDKVWDDAHPFDPYLWLEFLGRPDGLAIDRLTRRWPYKIVQAKFFSMKRRGLIDLPNRDYIPTLTEAGREILRRAA